MKRIIQSMLSPDIRIPESQSTYSIVNNGIISILSQYCTSEIEEGPSLTVESCQGEADKDDTSAKKGSWDDAIR